ncbi:hypothetical protein VE01_04326 [Pseudogymnoascus verrucosus]|uniref:2EXR domain-containing protein n=1 Tax=Pseudogymnoascus verrucosus TaxID=342668 RepID=A0A1B8GNM2_9PEZI|nr:uncharacterized protein VE01_04326 [Pseudogymnoascus verrucosus]OBT97406.2 hypothetical protein VE01_04326 [Pseudogymnoascus verrucosus]
MPPKRCIEDVDLANREAVKRIRKLTFHDGTTIDGCLEAYLKHHGIDPAVESLKLQRGHRDAARFRQRMEAAAAKTLYEAAGLTEPSPDDEKVKKSWYLADDMDSGEDEELVEKMDSDVEDMITGGRVQTRQGKNLTTSALGRSAVFNPTVYFTPYSATKRDVFDRVIPGLERYQHPSEEEKTASIFRANAILEAAFKAHPQEIMQRLSDVEFMTFGKSNELNFPSPDKESVDRFGNASFNFTTAFPATTLDKTIKGSVIKLKAPSEDGTTKLRVMNVSASPLWSGRTGLHTQPDRRCRMIQLNTLSPEEIHLGDYYAHAFHSVAPHQFARFAELPTLVQDLIWEFSFESRVVEIQYDPKFTRMWSPTKWPAQSFVCKQSNAVMRRVYERSPFGDATARRGLLFNFDVDVLFLTFEKRGQVNMEGQIPLRVKKQSKVVLDFLHSLPPAQLPKIRHLGLDLQTWRMIEHDMYQHRRRRHKIRGQERFVLPILTGLRSLRIIENNNVGCWRINRQMGFEAMAHENLVARQCPPIDLALDMNSVRFDISQLFPGRSPQPDGIRLCWWNGSGVISMTRVTR